MFPSQSNRRKQKSTNLYSNFDLLTSTLNMATPSQSSSLSPSPRKLIARTDEQILYAAKTDSLEMLNEVLTGFPPEEFDLNFQDGLGNTGKLSHSFF